MTPEPSFPDRDPRPSDVNSDAGDGTDASSILDEVIRVTEESDSLVVIEVFRNLAPQYPDLPIEDVGGLEMLGKKIGPNS